MLVDSLIRYGAKRTRVTSEEARLGRTRKEIEKSSLPSEMIESIVQVVIHHSEKENVGAPLEEIVKDADIYA